MIADNFGGKTPKELKSIRFFRKEKKGGLETQLSTLPTPQAGISLKKDKEDSHRSLWVPLVGWGIVNEQMVFRYLYLCICQISLFIGDMFPHPLSK